MTTLPPHQHAAQYLRNDNTILRALFTRIKQLDVLNSLLATYIDPKLVNHCRVTNYENQCLFLMTESAIWGTHIRFQVPQLISQLKQHPELRDLTTIHCKVMPSVKTPRMHSSPKYQPAQRLSTETAELILRIADSIEESPLKATMKRIATRTKR